MTGPLMVDVAGLQLDGEDLELLQHPAVGGVILFARNFADYDQLVALVADIRKLRPELLIAADYEGGRVQRFRDGFTRIPPMRALGRAYDRDARAGQAAARQMGYLIGAELAAVDIDLPFAPVLDLEDGHSQVIGDRALHHDPQVVTALAKALVDGLAQTGTAATGKHFPGHGAVREDSHATLPVDNRENNEIMAGMQPFIELIEYGLQSVMMAHIRYPAVDAQPASLSSAWIGEHLRHGLGFTGVVVCDDLSMGGAAAVGDYPQRMHQALQAGCDILPVCNNRAAVVTLLDAVPLERHPRRAARLASLRRSGVAPGRQQLHASAQWRNAQGTAMRLGAQQ